jgi:hypothetical protein
MALIGGELSLDSKPKPLVITAAATTATAPMTAMATWVRCDVGGLGATEARGCA